MSYQDRFYTTGVVTVQNGSAVVIGDGTGWETALIDGGVIFVGGGSYPILSVESETSLTLAMPYAGDDGSALLYAIDRQRAAATSNIQMNDRLAQIIREISIGNIESLNAIDFTGREILQTDATGLLIAIKLAANKFLRTDANGDLALSDLGSAAIALLNLSGTAAADRLPYLTGASGAGLTILTAFARSILDDANGDAVWNTIGGTQFLDVNGYVKLPGGAMFQKGSSIVTSNSGGGFTFVFPSAFVNASHITIMSNGDRNVNSLISPVINRDALSSGGVNGVLINTGTGGTFPNQTARVDWQSFGSWK